MDFIAVVYSLQAARATAVFPGVVEQIHHRTVDGFGPQQHRFQARRQGQGERTANRVLAFVQGTQQGSKVGTAGRFARFGAGVIHELRDHGFHLLDIGTHPLLCSGVADAHFDFQAQPGERGAQIVRDAGQDFGAVFFVPRQIVRHGVECRGQGAYFFCTFFRQWRRRLTAAKGLRRTGKGFQRAADARGDQPGNDQRQSDGQNHPAQPAGGKVAAGPLARQHQPVFVGIAGVEAEADPEAGFAIDLGSDACLFAQACHEVFPQQLVKARFRHGQDDVVFFGRQQTDAFSGGKFSQ